VLRADASSTLLSRPQYLTRPDPGDTSVNKWQARMGQPFEAWEKNGWLRPEHDARGWFSWYYRFYLGRRCDDDARQVQRWAGVAGNSGRFKRMLLGKYRDRGVRASLVSLELRRRHDTQSRSLLMPRSPRP